MIYNDGYSKTGATSSNINNKNLKMNSNQQIGSLCIKHIICDKNENSIKFPPEYQI